MLRTLVTRLMLSLAALGLAAVLTTPVAAQGTGFTYQGSLDEAGAPANGAYDFRFRLFDATSGGAQIGSTLCVDNVNVVRGVFTTALDFGPQFATAGERHLEIEVRRDSGATCADANGFVVMLPRQQVTATPRASHAQSAFSLAAPDGSPANAVSVDNAGNVGIGTSAPFKLLHIRGFQPAIAIQDTASDANQSGYISFRNNTSTETAWVGYGTSGSPHFSIVNARTGGNISLEAITITSGGSVGIGTATPASTLDVRGDIRMGPSGQYQATSGEEKLRIVRGRITPSGAISAGSGFTATRTATGLYTISFTTPFPGAPVITLSPAVASSGGPYCAHTNGVSTSVAGVRITTASGTNIDDTFDFIAIGAR